ncbi:MAG TPA: oligosaccharide flippase family protein [Vicinamibacterales bacterium]|nr:oligosaccharide flippase family protein [Vicinamibacterales bacterium]
MYTTVECSQPAAPSLKRNAIANGLGRLWAALLTIATIPVFVRVLGTEAYGLVAIFSSLNMVIALLDLGLTATINREIARFRALGRPPSESATVLRTFEVVYWAIALAIGTAIAFASGSIAHHWVNVRHLSRTDVKLAILIMAVAIAARWPVSMYGGVLQGLEQQVRQNAVVMLAATVRTAGAAVVVLLIAPTIAAFLWTQVAAALVEVAGTAVMAWRGLAARPTRHFDVNCLRSVWRFAVGFNVIGALAMVASQADRLVLSRYRVLDEVGFYAIACTAAGAVPLIASSVGAALFPKFSAISAQHDRRRLTRVYTDGVHAVALLAVPAGLTVLFFAHPVLALWMHSSHLADRASVALAILALASILNALQNPAYNLLLAAGRIRVVLAVGVINAIVFISLMVAFIPRWGINAAAAIWLAQNVVFVVVFPRAIASELELDRSWISPMPGVAAIIALGSLWFGGAWIVSGVTPSIRMAVEFGVAAIGYAGTAGVLARRLRIYPFTRRVAAVAPDGRPQPAIGSLEQEPVCPV